MNIKNRLKRSFKLRFAILYPFGLFLMLFANSDDKSIAASIGFIVLGLFIRLWANGYAIKMEKLSTCGPYAYVRHPLYLGTMLLVIGFFIMLKLYYPVWLIFAWVFIVVYYKTIKKEEKMLEDKFKSAYLKYKEKVPAIIPTVFAYQQGEKWAFSFKRLIHNQEYKLFLWIIIVIIAFHLKSEFMVEHEKIDAKIVWLIIVAFILGFSDLAGEFFKWKGKKAKGV